MNKYIDHTLLKATATQKDIENICKEAIENKFASVCINPCNVAQAYNLLKDSEVKTCTVIGFPLGANTIETKVFETKDAIKNGAQEIDMVINIAALKDGRLDYIEDEVSQILEACATNAILKVIIETCYLSDEEKINMCKIVDKVGANFIKTSTGFGTDGATKEDIKLFKETLSDKILIKASGGIKNKQQANEYINLGCSRLGTSNGVNIANGVESISTY
jgi:deoxyribose-phosphate aldolase